MYMYVYYTCIYIYRVTCQSTHVHVPQCTCTYVNVPPQFTCTGLLDYNSKYMYSHRTCTGLLECNSKYTSTGLLQSTCTCVL